MQARNVFNVYLQRSAKGFSPVVARTYTTIDWSKYNEHSAMPLIEKYRPKLFDQDFQGKSELPPLPPRTIPDDILRFEQKTSFEKGLATFYPHIQTNPVDLKVKLKVYIDDLGLSEIEKGILIRMLGPRYNVGKKEIKLTFDSFPNPIENRRYVLIQLEQLVQESKRLASISHEYKEK